MNFMNYLKPAELNRRIALDFNKTLNDILLEIKEIYPNPTPEQIELWEKTLALEFIEINGEKRYFRRAARNLFRINGEAKMLYIQKFGDERQKRNDFLKNDLPEIIQKPYEQSFTFEFQLKVKPDAVPDGEIIRCWLPYPRKDVDYQQNIKLLSVNSENYQIEQNGCHSTIYLEKQAKKAKETIFEVKYQLQVAGYNLQDAKMQNNSHSSPLTPNFLNEQHPHIVFTEDIKKLSIQIIGNEQDKYLIAKKIFTWISENIIWAAAREYSTISNIPQYVLANRHGDCGQVTLLFITLCRFNNIPARWLSGFMLHPNCENLHDWAEIFIDGKGWLPVDVSFGLQQWADNEQLQYFYFGNMDAWRLIVNNGISGKFLPAKHFERSETVDFQRGEAEWKGGNLYFDSFDYDFKVITN
jgi:hypothetical protein